MLDALTAYYSEDNANVHRGVHLLSERATQAFEDARATVQRFINAASAREIVFTRNATEGINLVAQTFGRTRLGPGDEVVISAMEHHSNIVPWQMVCEEKGASLRVIPITDEGELQLEEYERLLGPAHAAGLDRPSVERARDDQSRPADDRDGASPWRTGAHRRIPGGASHDGGRPGARRRLLRVHGPQAVRTDRDWRVVRQGARCSRRCRRIRVAAT